MRERTHKDTNKDLISNVFILPIFNQDVELKSSTFKLKPMTETCSNYSNVQTSNMLTECLRLNFTATLHEDIWKGNHTLLKNLVDKFHKNQVKFYIKT